MKCEKKNHNAILQTLWNKEIEILDLIDEICNKNGLKYSLMYGTLLGAVRHGGFIPWDDDIDLIMPRADYERFIEIWNRESPEGFVLVDRDSYPDYPNNFLKIVNRNTTFLQKETDRQKTFPKGIFVDVFPADRFAPKGILRYKQLLDCMINMLLTRNYQSGVGGAVAFVERIILRLPKTLRERWRGRTEKAIQIWNNRSNLPYLVPVTVCSCKRKYPPSMFDGLQKMGFQGGAYSAFSDYDTVLQIVFGDYMKLPPESERVWKHHPLILDFEHDYEELQQKTAAGRFSGL